MNNIFLYICPFCSKEHSSMLLITPLFLLAIPLVLGVVYILCHFYNKNKKRKQHCMFIQLKSGDYVWAIKGYKLSEFQVDKVKYEFSGQRIVEILITLTNYDNIRLRPSEAKEFKCIYNYTEYYTLKKEAETVFSLMKQMKEKEIKDTLNVTPEEFAIKLNERIKEIQKLGEKTIKKLEIKI